MTPLFRHALPVAAASLLVLAGCQKPAATPKPVANGAPGATPAAASAGPAVAGLPTEKDKVSYMIGMDMAKALEPAKDEIDLDVMLKAIRASLAGEKLLLDEKQAGEIRESFGQKMQLVQLQKAQAEQKKNSEAGEKFLAENGKKPEVKTTASGLQYQVLSEGTGPKPKTTDAVKVKYKGTLLNGKEFDSTDAHGGEPAVMPVGRVIPGWSEGVQLMSVGSKYRFWIPAKLAYGEQGTPGGPIPPNSTLIFDVELLGIEKVPAGAAGPAAPARGK